MSVSKQELRGAAIQFLRAVCESAQASLGSLSVREQTSSWMVSAGTGSMSSKEFTRTCLDKGAVLNYYRELPSCPEELQLMGLLSEAGVATLETSSGYLLPLVRHWLEISDSLEFEESAASEVLDEFTIAVTEGQIPVISFDVMTGIKLSAEALTLDDEVSIRPISSEELWQLGDTQLMGVYFYRFPPPHVASENWAILEIITRTADRGSDQLNRASDRVEELRHAAMAALQLCQSGRIVLVPWGEEYHYGYVSHAIRGGYAPSSVGFPGVGYELDVAVAERISSFWPKFRQIMSSQGHKLRLSARRFLDGARRTRDDDAIVDYTIGLEALLLPGGSDELQYRFALRGSTILSWDGKAQKPEAFEELKRLYRTRSRIVHGGSIDQSELPAVKLEGEKALRTIWWWYFDHGKSPSDAMAMVDARILES